MTRKEAFDISREDWKKEDEDFKTAGSYSFQTETARWLANLEQVESFANRVIKQLESLNQQMANAKTAALFDNAKVVDGIKLVSARMDGTAPDALRKLGDSVKDKEEAIIALFAAVNGEKGTLYCVCTRSTIYMVWIVSWGIEGTIIIWINFLYPSTNSINTLNT